MTIVEDERGGRESSGQPSRLIKPIKSQLIGQRQELFKSHSRSGSRGPKTISLSREISRHQSSPHRDIYEAKFEKFKANKAQKQSRERRQKAFEKPDFDITTKNPGSPSKKAGKYTTVVGAEKNFKPSGKYDPETLMPPDYEDHLLREEEIKRRAADPFEILGVSTDDKMTFFLLKWVFSVIKQDSDVEDKELKG